MITPDPGEKHGSFEDSKLGGIGQRADGTIERGVPLSDLPQLLARQRAEYDAQTYAIEQSKIGFPDPDESDDDLDDLDEEVEDMFDTDANEAEDTWSEADHPRGQPDNAGQFASNPGGTGGNASSEKSKKTSAASVKVFHGGQAIQYVPGIKASGLAAADAKKAEWRGSAPNTVEAIMAVSGRHQDALVAAAQEIADDLGVDFKNPGPKSEKRLRDKVARGKTPDMITDAVRGGFDVWTPEQADLVVDELAKRFEVADEGWQKTAAGYFDRKVMVRFDDGTVGEIQVWPPGMLETKEKRAHPLYVAWQNEPPGPQKMALLNAQLALFASLCSHLTSVWHAIINC